GSDKKELSLTKLESSSNAWRVQDDSLKASSLEGSLRLNVDGKTSEAPLVAGSSAISMNSGSHNGRILSLGANAPRLEMTQDASKGMLTFYVVEEKSETFATPVSFSEAPVLEVTTASGPKSFTLTRVEGQPNAWSATDPMLRSADVRGTI